ncbi:MAG: CocE/NonD family hydrolase [Cryobacterium sp.]|nr:CocE/NonD family hydrolase [Cryobacterium sp.]
MERNPNPLKRPGRVRYSFARLRSAVRPPVKVHRISEDVRETLDVPARMRDGVNLRINVYKPKGEGRYPVIVSEHPYGKDALPKKRWIGWKLNFQYRIMNQPTAIQISDRTGWEAPDPEFWVQNGFVVINADARGSGNSEGIGALFSDQEARDIHDLIEWAAVQPWSNGRVGMLGVSYLAISQYKAASLNPPSLKAICPWEGLTDAYKDLMMPGGIREIGFSRIWLAMTKRVVRMDRDLANERLEHPLRDSWWKEFTPALDKIQVPMLACASFSDANLHSVGSLRAFESAGSNEKYAYMHREGKWAAFYSDEGKSTQLEFFNHYLRTGTAPKPAKVTLKVNESRTKVTSKLSEEEWPISRTNWQTLHLEPLGILSRAETAASEATFQLKRGALSFDFDFDADSDVIGEMNLQLWAKFDVATEANLFVAVEKWHQDEYVPFEGSYGYGRDRVARGFQTVSLRALNHDLSSPHKPIHDFDHAMPFKSGKPVELAIPLTPSATRFHKGETLRLIICGRYPEPKNPIFGHFPARYLPSKTGTCTLMFGDQHDSRLEIPVVPSRS